MFGEVQLPNAAVLDIRRHHPGGLGCRNQLPKRVEKSNLLSPDQGREGNQV